MKNPDRVFVQPVNTKSVGINPIIARNYALLLCLPRKFDDWNIDTNQLNRLNIADRANVDVLCGKKTGTSGQDAGTGGQDAGTSVSQAIGNQTPTEADAVAEYLFAGLALSDEYCDMFFEDADESQRRRQYGRALWNDTGTALSTILGLANAGENVVTGIAAGFGLGDSAWRNYDEAFVVGPDLANAKSLVQAQQSLFRAELKSGKKNASTFYEAQSLIREHANICSFLGMKGILNKAAAEKQDKIESKIADEKPGSQDKTEGGRAEGGG
ncbi:hypothetical protein GCM10022213_07290 [Parerythrobacter jejuensis]